MSEPWRIALVGLGKIARDQHLPAIAADPAFVLAATVDPAGGGLADVPHFASLAELGGSGTAVDAVALCTPPQVRVALGREALGMGLHLLLEKPPAPTSAALAELEAAAAQAGRTLFTAWHSRYAAGVEPARSWLAGRAIRSVAITWREDVRHWHPGQDWIWQPGGFGVFDPGINALSIATAILPQPLDVRGGTLQVPGNCHAPIAGLVEMADTAGLPVTMDLDFLQTGPQTWDIVVECDGGPLVLSLGGSRLQTPDGVVTAPDAEYPEIYRHFARLLAAGESHVDAAPLRLAEEAVARCAVERVADFIE